MRTAEQVFKETLEELGFANHKPSQMSNSDYWMCTCEAMKKFAKEALIEASEKAKLEKSYGYGHFNPDEAVFNPSDTNQFFKETYGHGDMGYEAVRINKESIINITLE